MTCAVCKGELWVCENHPDVPWNDGKPSCCGGAGMPCKCNVSNPPAWPPGTLVLLDREHGTAH